MQYAVALAWILSLPVFASGFSRGALQPGDDCYPASDDSDSGSNSNINFYTPFIGLAWLTLLVLYVKIFKEWLKIRRTQMPVVMQQHATDQGNTGNTGTNNNATSSHRNETNTSESKQSLKITLMILPVIGTIFLTWSSFVLIISLTGKRETYMDKVWYSIGVWIISTNYYLNPILYGVFHKDLRDKFKKFIKCV